MFHCVPGVPQKNGTLCVRSYINFRFMLNGCREAPVKH